MCFSLDRVKFIAVTECLVKRGLQGDLLLLGTFSQRIIRKSPINYTAKEEKNYFKGKLASSLDEEMVRKLCSTKLMVRAVMLPKWNNSFPIPMYLNSDNLQNVSVLLQIDKARIRQWIT